MRVIITGGTGVIGQRLANNLVEDDHEVIVLSRSPALAEGLDPRVHVEGWDAKTAKGWGHLASGADAIVNFAGANLAGTGFFPSRWTDERKKAIIDSRINAGKAVLEAIDQAEVKPKVLIQSSAVGYYGARGDEEITEQSTAGNDWLAEVCKKWEAVTEPASSIMRHITIRTGIYISFEDGALQRLALPYQMFVGGPLGSGKQYYSWIHPDDQIGAIRFLIEHPTASGPFNLTAPNPVTNAEFGHALGRVMGRPSLIPVPGFAFQIAFGEVSTVVLTGQRVIPERLLELGYQFKFEEVEAAIQDLYNREVVPV